jgi:hypothetical protein
MIKLCVLANPRLKRAGRALRRVQGSLGKPEWGKGDYKFLRHYFAESTHAHVAGDNSVKYATAA